MRMGRAAAVKPDCFVALVISTETYSGMFLSAPRLPRRAGSSRAELWPRSLLRGLGGSGPNQREQTAFNHFAPTFVFRFRRQRGWGRNKRLHKARASAVFERDDPRNEDLKGNNPGNVIVFFILHLGEAFLSLPPSCEGRGYDPWNGFEKNPLQKKRKTLETLTKKVQIC